MKDQFKVLGLMFGAALIGLAAYAAWGVLYDMHQITHQQCQQIGQAVIDQEVAAAKAEWQAELEEEKDGEDVP